jgi:hypothetical protein
MHVRGLAHASSNRWQAISHNAGCAHNISTACDPFDPRDIWALQVRQRAHQPAVPSCSMLHAPCSRYNIYLDLTYCTCINLQQMSFGIVEAQMVGWWAEIEEGAAVLPVRSSASNIKVTTYVRKGNSALIVLANFGSLDTSVGLTFNWTLLGLPSGGVGCVLSAPGLRVPPQKAQSMQLGSSVHVPAPTKGAPDSLDGLILLLKKK